MRLRSTLVTAGALLVLTTLSACGGKANEDVVTAVSGVAAQVQKADTDAMAAARSAQVAMETYSLDNGGTYEGATAASLVAADPTLSGQPVSVSATSTGYTVTATSAQGGNTFSITNSGGGVLSYTCQVPGAGACPVGGSWGS